MVGIAAMIGGSIFVLTGPAIGLAGSAVITVFIINGIITLFTAMAYAELGSAMPEAGGGYLWVREGLPRPMYKWLRSTLIVFALLAACLAGGGIYSRYFDEPGGRSSMTDYVEPIQVI